MTISFSARVNPLEAAEGAVVEGLHPDADPVDAGFAQGGEALGLGRSGVRLEGDLRPGRQVPFPADCIEKAGDLLRGEKRGRPAAEENRIDFSSGGAEAPAAAFDLADER